MLFALILSYALAALEIPCLEEEDGQCVRCPRGYVPNQRFNACVWKSSADPPIVCPDGYFSNNGVCTQCHPSCESCKRTSGPNSCTSCARGYYPTYAAGSGRCVHCSLSTEAIAGILGCIHCALDGSSLYCLEYEGSYRRGSRTRHAFFIIAILCVLVFSGGLLAMTVRGPKRNKYHKLPTRYSAQHKMV